MYMHLWIYTPSKSHDKIPLTRLHKRNQIDRIGLSADLISEPHRWWYNYDGALTSPHGTGPAINSTTCQNNCLMVTWSLYVHVIRSSPALLLLLLFECLRYPIPSRMHWYELPAHAYAILPRFRAAEAILPRAAPAYSYTFSKDEKRTVAKILIGYRIRGVYVGQMTPNEKFHWAPVERSPLLVREAISGSPSTQRDDNDLWHQAISTGLTEGHCIFRKSETWSMNALKPVEGNTW